MYLGIRKNGNLDRLDRHCLKVALKTFHLNCNTMFKGWRSLRESAGALKPNPAHRSLNLCPHFKRVSRLKASIDTHIQTYPYNISMELWYSLFIGIPAITLFQFPVYTRLRTFSHLRFTPTTIFQQTTHTHTYKRVQLMFAKLDPRKRGNYPIYRGVDLLLEDDMRKFPYICV